MTRRRAIPLVTPFLAGFLFAITLATGTCLAAGHIAVQPPEVHLQGWFAQSQLVVMDANDQGQFQPASGDRTLEARYASDNESVVRVIGPGRLLAAGNGKARVAVTVGEQRLEVPVTVEGYGPQPNIGYDRYVIPVISKAGCNKGGCHATQNGKGGLKLTVFAYAPEEDHRYLVRDSVQRRVDFIDPDRSLMLLKPTAQIPHGGGKRLDKDSIDYQILRAWILGGAPGPRSDAPRVEKLTVFPVRRTGPKGLTQQLRVDARYTDGTVRDVTAWSKFDSVDEGMLTVTPAGLVTVQGQGQSPVMVRFEGQAEIAMFSVPYRNGVELAGWSNQNYIDELASAKFRELGIEPSGLCDDATFLRRAFLDAIGTLPTLEETRAFLAATEADKRARLIDRLLGLTGDPAQDVYNDRYAAFWTLRWSDLVRNNSNDLGDQGMWALHNWILDAFRVNKPYNEFVRELVTAQGSIYSSGPANFFLVNSDAPSRAEATSQLFLGVRLECAKCHHHPFEKYGQDDYYGFAAFFARVGLKNSEEFGLFGRERVVVVNGSGEVNQPKTGRRMAPTPLEGKPTDNALDRRLALADWLTSPDNTYFAHSVVNRYVAWLLGRGLVEPVDDLRSTNPPTNPELMDALAQRFVGNHFNLKLLMRDIMDSRLYQLAGQPLPANATDDRFYSHYFVKRLGAEMLLDAVDQVTGSSTKFKSLPRGTRSIELPDAEYPNYFLTTFGKPRRTSVCECERSHDPNLAQALHTLNGDIVAQKISDGKGRLAERLKAKAPPEQIVDEFYLAALGRPPSAAERQTCQDWIAQSSTPQEGLEDIVWALLNSKQFLFVH